MGRWQIFYPLNSLVFKDIVNEKITAGHIFAALNGYTYIFPRSNWALMFIRQNHRYSYLVSFYSRMEDAIQNQDTVYAVLPYSPLSILFIPV